MSIKNIYNIIKSSLQGHHRDYTQGNISESVILLAIPMILELGLESVFAVVDMFFVSGLGANAIATVGLTEAVVTLVYSVAIGISTGATAIVARRFGEKDLDKAAHSGAQAIVLGVIISLFVGAIGLVYAGDILKIMGASPEVVSEGTPFARIMMGGTLSIMLLFLINGIFRGVGDAAMAMKSLWLASGVNIVLCPVLIHFLGLKGAALATLIGRSSGVVYQSLHLFKGDGELKLRKVHFQWDPDIIKSILSISWPASLQFLIGSGSWIVLTRLVAEMGGTTVSAGYQIAFRNFVFFILPAWGLSNAAATLMGQNLGAKQIDRAEQSVWITVKYSAVFMALITGFLLLLSRPIIGIFTQDTQVFYYGVEGLRIISSGFIFYGVSMVLTQSLNGAGDTKVPTKINFVCLWLVQIPMAYFLAKQTSLGVLGVLLTLPLTHALITLIAWIYFRQGQWKKVQL